MSKSILDRSFVYIPSGQTDLKKTFAKIRREQRQQAEQERKQAEERLNGAVRSIKERRQA